MEDKVLPTEMERNIPPEPLKNESVAEHLPRRDTTSDFEVSGVSSDHTETMSLPSREASERKEHPAEETSFVVQLEAPDSPRLDRVTLKESPPNLTLTSGRVKRTTWAPLPKRKPRRDRLSQLRDHRACCLVYALVAMVILIVVLMYCIVMKDPSNEISEAPVTEGQD